MSLLEKDITQEVDVTATSPEPKIEHPKQQTTAETDDEKLKTLKAEMKRSLETRHYGKRRNGGVPF
ncbi:hypothetical protein P7H06_21900 [Paenibacillus larvae]|nr:hypothetical protein [Paenibacillus larvae]MDT2261616.1 hypothetical protein [Paenibacillus larvae]